MKTYAKPRHITGFDYVPAINLSNGEKASLKLHDWVRCEQPDILDDEEFNLIIEHEPGCFYRVKSLDYVFTDAEDEVLAAEKAHPHFDAANDGKPECYNQETISIKAVCDVL